MARHVSSLPCTLRAGDPYIVPSSTSGSARPILRTMSKVTFLAGIEIYVLSVLIDRWSPLGGALNVCGRLLVFSFRREPVPLHSESLPRPEASRQVPSRIDCLARRRVRMLVSGFVLRVKRTRLGLAVHALVLA